MVMTTLIPERKERMVMSELPVIDLSGKRDKVRKLMVKACEEFGFFKVINHGVPKEIIDNVEKESKEFFSLPDTEKQTAGPPNPLGYGSKKIGFNGDTGDLEYLILQAEPTSIIFKHYLMRALACDLLELLGEGLGQRLTNMKNKDDKGSRVGFGEHSDPQILTILRSNNVEGLQIQSPLDANGWIPVKSDPSALFINVGDALQAMTNGRFVSVRHRAIVNAQRSRLSTMFFAAPSLQACICPLP